MSVQAQVYAQFIKMYLHTHTTVSVSSVEEQLNKQMIMHTHITNNFDTYFCGDTFLQFPLNF